MAHVSPSIFVMILSLNELEKRNLVFLSPKPYAGQSVIASLYHIDSENFSYHNLVALSRKSESDQRSHVLKFLIASNLLLAAGENILSLAVSKNITSS